jgi:hypothetical protein
VPAVGGTYDAFRRMQESDKDEQRSDQRFGMGCGYLESIEPASGVLNRGFSASAAVTDAAGKNFITKTEAICNPLLWGNASGALGKTRD